MTPLFLRAPCTPSHFRPVAASAPPKGALASFGRPGVPARNFSIDPFYVMISGILLYPLVSDAIKQYHQRQIMKIELKNPSATPGKINLLIQKRDQRIEKLPMQFHEEVVRINQEREIDRETIESIREILGQK